MQADKDKFKKFKTLVEEETFEKKLDSAGANPESLDALRLLDKLNPLIQTIGEKIHRSVNERTSSMSNMYALAQNFLAPFIFVTISPKVIENELCWKRSI